MEADDGFDVCTPKPSVAKKNSDETWFSDGDSAFGDSEFVTSKELERRLMLTDVASEA